MMPFGMPGPGGSLGQCAYCGQNFLLEVLTGNTVKSLHISGVGSELFFHSNCAKKMKDGMDWHELPEASPLRHAFEQATAPLKEQL